MFVIDEMADFEIPSRFVAALEMNGIEYSIHFVEMTEYKVRRFEISSQDLLVTDNRLNEEIADSADDAEAISRVAQFVNAHETVIV